MYEMPTGYWCPGCWTWKQDCPHLVEPLDAPVVKLDDWQYIYARYDRQRRILELTTNVGDAFQFFNVPRSIAIAFVKSPEPANLCVGTHQGEVQVSTGRG